MSSISPVLKDLENEHPVPTAWRNTLASVVDRLVRGDFALAESVPGVSRIDLRTADSIARNIATYGGTLVTLPDTAWKTSVSSWQDGYWEVLVDLFATDGASDLVLDVRVREDPSVPEIYRFDVHLVYVP